MTQPSAQIATCRQLFIYVRNCLGNPFKIIVILTLVTEESLVAIMALALKGLITIPVDTPGQADALGAVGAHPANLADAVVGLGAVAAAGVARRVAHRVAAVVGRVRPSGHADYVAIGIADVAFSFL